MAALSPLVLEVLEAAGWSDGGAGQDRVHAWMDWLRKQGYPVLDSAEAALSSYGGLRVEVRGPGVNMSRQSFELDPVKTGLEIDRITDWAEDLGMPLVPLGLGDHGHYLIAIGRDGRVFAVSTDIAVIGANVDDAIENLVLGRRGARIDGTTPGGAQV